MYLEISVEAAKVVSVPSLPRQSRAALAVAVLPQPQLHLETSQGNGIVESMRPELADDTPMFCWTSCTPGIGLWLLGRGAPLLVALPD